MVPIVELSTKKGDFYATKSIGINARHNISKMVLKKFSFPAIISVFVDDVKSHFSHVNTNENFLSGFVLSFVPYSDNEAGKELKKTQLSFEGG